MSIDDMRLPDGNGGWYDAKGNRGRLEPDGSVQSPFSQNIQKIELSLQDIARGASLRQFDKMALEMLLRGLAKDMMAMVKGDGAVKEFEAVHKKQQEHDLNYLKELKKIHSRTNWSNIFFGSTFLLLSIIQFIHSLK